MGNIKTAAADANPTVTVDMGALSEGNIELEIDWGFDPNVLPKNVNKAFNAITGLVDNIKAVVTGAAELPAQFESVKEAIEGLPKDPSAIKDAAGDSNLTPMQIMAVPKKVASNSAEFAKAPPIIPQLLDT